MSNFFRLCANSRIGLRDGRTVVMTPRLKNPRTAFPRAKVESALTAWWDQRTGSALAQRRPPEECRRLGGTVFDIQPAICSVEAALAVLQLEPLLSFQLSKNLMPRGGHNDREEFVQDVASRLEIDYAKHYGPTRARQPAG